MFLFYIWTHRILINFELKLNFKVENNFNLHVHAYDV